MGIEIIAGLLASAALSAGVEVSATFATIGAYALVGGAIVGGTILLEQLEKQHVNEQQTLKQSLPPRQRCYGRCLVGGAYYFFANNGGVLVSGFVLSGGPIDSFQEHWFNDQISPDGSALNGFADTYPWYQNIGFSSQLGYTDQTTNGAIQYQFPAWWDNNHRLRGLANTVMFCILPGNPTKNFSKKFPSGVPTYKAVIKGVLVYDPRDASQNWDDATKLSWKWSANSSLIALDYLTDVDGMNIAKVNVDLPSFMAFADLCDQEVALAAGGGETRYVAWGAYTLDEDPKNVIARILKSCDGELYMTPQGKVAIRGGQWTEPTFTITPDMILALDVERGRGKLSKFNQLRIRYTSVPNQYQQIEGDPWDDIDDQDVSGEVIPEDFDVIMCPSYTQAQRLAKIFMAKSNPDWILNVTTTLAGLNALGERIGTLIFPDLGINDTFFVNSFDIDENGLSCKIGLGSLSSDTYEWSTAEEKQPAGQSLVNVATPGEVPSPTGFALSIERVAIDSSTNAATLSASVDVPADDTLGMVAQYRLSGTTAWQDMVADATTYTAQSPIVSDGSTYNVQVAFETYGGTTGAFVSGSIEVVADNTSPGAPTSFALAPGSAGYVALSWNAPSASNYYASQIYRGSTNDVTQASVIATKFGSPGSSLTATEPTQSGQNYFWIKAVNRSGVGDFAGPLGYVAT